MQLRAARLCLKKAHATEKQVSLVLAGDLQAQCTASSYALRELHLPFVGLFGACSTMAEALGLGAALLQHGPCRRPAGHDVQPFLRGGAAVPHAVELWCRPHAHGPVDRHGGGVLPAPPCRAGRGHCRRHLWPGGGLPDQGYQQHGRRHGPAAAATLLRYLHDTGQEPKDFDAIYTGDLGHLGSRLFREILTAEGLVMKNHIDCGSILYDAARQNVKSGGSGPGCCAAVLCGRILPRLERGSYRRVLFIATGALMSQTTFLQREHPAIAHLVELRGPECTARG